MAKKTNSHYTVHIAPDRIIAFDADAHAETKKFVAFMLDGKEVAKFYIGAGLIGFYREEDEDGTTD